jgi:hypothetical protein
MNSLTQNSRWSRMADVKEVKNNTTWFWVCMYSYKRKLDERRPMHGMK